VSGAKCGSHLNFAPKSISLTEAGRHLKVKAKAVPTEIAAIVTAADVSIEELRAAIITLRDGIEEQISP
jgi:hypothetical protein